MSQAIFALLCIGAVVALALRHASLERWAAAAAVLTILGWAGIPFVGPVFTAWWPIIIGLLIAGALAALSVPDLRSKVVTRPAYNALKKAMPTVSRTEREALEAGTVGWDAQLFSGAPDWSKLKKVPRPSLNDDERTFLDGPTQELCSRVDDWAIRQIHRDVPEETWRFLSEKGFFGMLISKEHGGLGFSAQAQSLVVGKIASRSPDISTVVMVPNSLGPGELIEKYGTQQQKDRFLPRLAKGEEIPCFGLTGPHSGSDAAAMRDIGIVAKGEHEGNEVLGIRLTWDKRYITLGPNATLLGIAFRLYDPEGHLGREEDIGITLALVPANHPGVEIGRRHLPCGAAFPNGPNRGRDVFIPMDWVIGGAARAGQGWRMLMECLSAGRAISLPATSTAAAKAMLRASTAYARIRKQFGLPIAHMDGVEEPLARLVEAAYLTESGRSVTACMLAAGEKPSVISALLKYQTTEWMRRAVNDALDIHGGRGICDGPSNYIQSAYQMVPVAITVEGANILTRTLITFAQGALRSHPWLFKEIEALQDWDEDRGLVSFEDAFNNHISFATANVVGALFHNLTFGLFASAPRHARHTRRWYRQLARASRNFALIADLSVALLGGGLKTRQKITGRLADALSELYLLSCVLKRFEDDGEPASDRVFVELCARNCLYRCEQALRAAVANFPLRWAAWIMLPLAFPLGARMRPAGDRLAKQAVRAALEPGEVRDRLTRDIYVTEDPADPVGLLEHTLKRVVAVTDADRKIERAVRSGDIRRNHSNDWIAEAESKGIVTAEEARALKETKELVARAIAVDDFDAADIRPGRASSDNESLAAE